MATKTLSIRVDDDDYRFISRFAKEEKEDVSKAVRELVDVGRVMLAIERYKKSETSLERASKIAGVSISKMMDILKEYGVEASLQFEDYFSSLNSIRKIW